MDTAAEPSPRTRSSLLRRSLIASLGGALAGAGLASIEGSLILALSPLPFAQASYQLFRVQVYYALACAAGSFGVALLLRRSSRGAIATTLALYGFFVGLTWIQVGLDTRNFLGPTFLACAGTWLCLALFLGRLLLRRAWKARLLLAIAAVLVVISQLGSLLLSAESGSTASSSAADAASNSNRSLPNVILIVVDTLRADRLSCYGYQRPTSPTLDALAREGAVFESAYAAAPWTRPSIASLMTGLHPSSHDVQTQWGKLPESLPTLAEHLDQQGYHTAGFTVNAQITPMFGFSRGFDHFWSRSGFSLLRTSGLGGWAHFLRKQIITSFLLPWIQKVNSKAISLQGTDARALNRQVDAWLAQRPPAQPLFLYLHYLDPHMPYAPLEDLLNEAKPDSTALHSRWDIPVERLPYPLGSFDAPEADLLQGLQDLYDAEIRYCDQALKHLFEQLQSEGLWQSSYVILTSDHGEEFLDHRNWLHGMSLFEELIRVPLLIRGPQIQPQRVADPVQLVDLFPTIAQWVGAPLEFPVHGRSLVETLQNGTIDQDRVIFSERLEQPALQAIRQGNRKLIRLEAPEGEIWMEFDLAADPGEQNDLVKARGQPSPELRRLLEQSRQAAGALLREKAELVEPTGEVLDALKALGYIEDEENGS
jgi:arylsulfatase A-like enzyme